MKQSVRRERLVVGSMATNCYLLIDHKSKNAIIIDPGDDAEYIIDSLQKEHARPILIVATHGHFDHIMAARAIQLAYDIPFALHGDDVFLLSRMQESARHFLGILTDPPPRITKRLKGGEILKVGVTGLSVIHVPGHTPGSICLSLPSEELAFVGDTMFAQGAVGRTDFSYSSRQDLEKSVRRILSLPPSTKLLPGHGEETSVRAEVRFHEL